MIGAIIGDIVGSAYEFNPTNDYDFEFFPNEASFTDDTICTIAIADALLRCRDFGESLHDWCRRYPNPKGGYGGRFALWVRSDKPQPYNSFGNGSAMRVSPVGWWFFETSDVYNAAAQSAICTHNHEMGVKGATCIAIAIFGALQRRIDGQKADEIKQALIELGANMHYNMDVNINQVKNHFDETCQGTVPVALWIIGQSHSFEDAIRRAVSLGADADTLGAIVGSIAEAIWEIPEWMKEKAMSYLSEDMGKVVRDFRKGVKMRREEHKQLMAQSAIMLWKLGLGNMGRYFNGENPLPDKTKIATKDSWSTEPWPEENDITFMKTDIDVSEADMDILRRGHIPDAMEDHWFMYSDDKAIRYYRSWTGMPAFEARYVKTNLGAKITSLKMNRELCQWGVNGDDAGLAFFLYLIDAETDNYPLEAWHNFLLECNKLNKKAKRHTSK